MLDPAIHAILVASAALVFLHSAWHKLFAHSAFRAQLQGYRLLPPAAVPWVAAALPVLELGALGLFVNQATRGLGALALGLLLAIYTAAMAVNIHRGRTDIDCGCVGAGAQPTLSPWLLLRNAAIFAGLLLALLGAAPRPLLWLDWCTIGLAVPMLLGFYWAMNRLLVNQALLNRLLR